MSALEFRDLAPYIGELSQSDHDWLARVAAVDPREYRIGVGEDRNEDEWLPLVERGPDGRWWAGRFIGSITVDGRRLVVEPRLGIDVVEAWLDQAFGLVAPPASARHSESETFIVRLLARLWCRSVDNATRHGLPLLRLPRSHEGSYVRGRLDMRRTILLIGEGRQTIASITHDRSLAHPVTRAIVCAERALAERLTSTAEWRTERVRQVLPHLRAGVGSRPKLPTLHEISRVRYTPITLPFRQAALLSHRIASRLGYGATDKEGKAEGILVDVAELWELFVLNCARQAAAPGMRVEHGTPLGAKTRSSAARAMTWEWAGSSRTSSSSTEMPSQRSSTRSTSGSSTHASGLTASTKPISTNSLRTRRAQADALRGARVPTVIQRRLTSRTAETRGPWKSDQQTFMFQRLATNAAECRLELQAMMRSGSV